MLPVSDAPLLMVNDPLFRVGLVESIVNVPEFFVDEFPAASTTEIRIIAAADSTAGTKKLIRLYEVFEFAPGVKALLPTEFHCDPSYSSTVKLDPETTLDSVSVQKTDP
ncbi:hypothetical protein B9G79_00325 [Bdellovibrio bacteriovorus]|uniref:Uncharacterized protein n=1 Tax=Bdellovibrio bacteriovorus TaxID=959 RepID=A0A1Z3N3R2_BDEBC|nr:hypothetical protein B9G79_00325 [Bdellovibrio bacteriovorus]